MHFQSLPVMILALGLLNNPVTSLAQVKTHKGFYLSIDLGPAFGKIKAVPTMGPTLNVIGTGLGFNAQVGAAIAENFILHGTIGFKSIFRPEINFGIGPPPPQKIKQEFDETIIGGGVTLYSKSNLFVTGNIGIGILSLYDQSQNITYKSDNGFGFQIKIGKEWWIESGWAMGFAFEYGRTFIRYIENTYEEKWSSKRFGIRVCATRNGRK